jgi:hypothetical protein
MSAILPDINSFMYHASRNQQVSRKVNRVADLHDQSRTVAVKDNGNRYIKMMAEISTHIEKDIFHSK